MINKFYFGRNKMKREYFFVILFLILTIFLSGCIGGEEK
jgi:hypothetical protein